MASYREILSKYDIRPRRRFGQNFLVDAGYLDAIVAAAGLEREDTVIEIGAGIGNLTAKLAQKAGRVIAIEFDRDMLRALRGELKAANIEVIEEDALGVDWKKLVGANTKAKAVANLPYNIATELIFRLLDAREAFSVMLLMTQLEVARRITADVGTKDYGVLSILTNLHANTRIELVIPSGAFRPQPKVDSAVIRFEILDKPRVELDDEKRFKKIVRAAFSQRRKTLANSLAASRIFGEERDAASRVLCECGIDPMRRAETLSMEEFSKLCNCSH